MFISAPLRHGSPVSRTRTVNGTSLAPRQLISVLGLTVDGRFHRQNAPAKERVSACIPPALCLRRDPWKALSAIPRQNCYNQAVWPYDPWALFMADVTHILSEIEHGDPTAAERLLPLVYDELRKLAAAKLSNEKPGQTLQATALVHEAYVRLVDVDESQSWNGRGHFFAAAAEAMRRILVEQARHKGRLKRGGDQQRVDLDSACAVSEPPSLDLLALDEALTKLAAHEPAKADLVKLRFFAGLTMPEAASALGISLATAERYWTFARSWLYAEIADHGPGPP